MSLSPVRPLLRTRVKSTQSSTAHTQFVTLLAKIVASLCVSVGIFVFWANPYLAYATELPAPSAVNLPAPVPGMLCWATANDGSTVHQSADSQAVRDAIADAVTNQTTVVKLAGYCADTVFDSDFFDDAIAIIDTPMTLLGGYTDTNWSTAYPVTQPTVLDALGNGHAIIATAPITVNGFTVMNGHINLQANYPSGAGIYAADALVASDMKIYSNTNAQYGGGIFADTLWMTNTELAYNVASFGGGVFVASSLLLPNAPQITLPTPLNAYVSKSVFYNNVALSGGGMAAYTAQVADSQFISNVAIHYGGGLYADYYGDINGTTFHANESWDSNLICCAPQRNTTLANHLLQRQPTALRGWLGARKAAAPTEAIAGGGGAWLGYADIIASQFISNTAIVAGGGAYLDVGAAITGTDFISNATILPILGAPMPDVGFTLSSGAGLACNIISLRRAPNDVGELLINGGTFDQNYSEGNGGGLASMCDTYITGAQFISNTAANAGGGVMAEAETVMISGTQFIGNEVWTYEEIVQRPRGADRPSAVYIGEGGGAWIDGADVQVVSSRFESNLAEGEGGGLFAYFPVISNTVFISNVASVEMQPLDGPQRPQELVGYGGGASLLGGVVHDSQFIGNEAALWGGGLIVYSDTAVSQNFFLGNVAIDGAGLDIEQSDSIVNVSNSVFARNRASSGGGAAIWTVGYLNLLHNTLTASDAITQSAIFLEQGHVALTNTVVANHAIGIDGMGVASAVGDHNVFYANTANTIVSSSIAVTLLNTLDVDPMFINPAGNNATDFRSSTNSRAIDAGMDSDLKVDYSDAARPQGLGPDVGAFEASALANLAIGIWPNPSPVRPGQALTFTAVVTNAGPDTAYDLVITATVGAKLQNMICDSSPACVVDGGIITVTLPQLAANATHVIALRGTVDATIIDDDAVLGQAGVQALRDQVPANNYAEATAQVRAIADLTISKWANAASVIAGERITYTLAYTNNGPGVAHMVMLTDTLPTGLQSVVCQTAVGMICTVGVGRVTLSTASMEVAESYTLTVSGIVNANAAAGSTLTNTVQISAANDVTTSNNSAIAVAGVQVSVDIAVSKSVAPSVVLAGNSLTYTLIITNNGPSMARNVLITDVLASELQNATCNSDAGGQCSVTGNAIAGSIATLGVNQAHRFVIAATVKSDVAHGTLISNSVRVSSDATDPDLSNGGGNNLVTPPEATALVQTQADLSTTVQVLGNLIQGQQGQIKVIVNNAGPSYGRPVTVAVTLPNGLSFGSTAQLSREVRGSRAVWNCSANGQVVTCATALIADGASDQFVLTVRVSDNAPESVTVLATVQSATSDPAAANNSSSQSATVTRPTAIVLARFVVEGNRVSWVTSAEIDTYGFHLWRSATGHRADAERITSALIAARGRQGQGGASYEFMDISANPNTQYTYWLQEIEIDGDTIEYGPAKAMMNRLFIPIVVSE